MRSVLGVESYLDLLEKAESVRNCPFRLGLAVYSVDDHGKREVES